MYHGSQRWWIEIIAGAMFSGKSEELMRRVHPDAVAVDEGNSEMRASRCRHCHMVPRADAAQTRLPLSS